MPSSQSIESEAATAEYTLPEPTKYKAENPHLMDYLEELDRSLALKATESRDQQLIFLMTGWLPGAMYTYELLRYQAERNLLPS